VYARLLIGAGVLVAFVAGAVALGRWERDRYLDESRDDIAQARSDVGPRLVSRQLAGTVDNPGLSCLQYAQRRTRGVSLCWDGAGRLVEATRFYGDRADTWSLADHPSAAKIHISARLLVALKRYAIERPSVLSVALVLRQNLNACLSWSRRVIVASAVGKSPHQPARLVWVNCFRAEHAIEDAVDAAPATKKWLGRLPLRFRRVTAALSYAGKLLATRLEDRRAWTNKKAGKKFRRLALSHYRVRRTRALARARVLSRPLATAVARQRERVQALER